MKQCLGIAATGLLITACGGEPPPEAGTKDTPFGTYKGMSKEALEEYAHLTTNARRDDDVKTYRSNQAPYNGYQANSYSYEIGQDGLCSVDATFDYPSSGQHPIISDIMQKYGKPDTQSVSESGNLIRYTAEDYKLQNRLRYIRIDATPYFLMVVYSYVDSADECK
ncbi:hypothetical protein QWY79_08485 [Halomonas sabkhae]|uniref:hypothetical protein n=1 Tax=Halomonas sabkhae TaxID=626223 RepID=UPI0025B591A7|nr:hypothetical protein [Halomonas sabkhae]MDN3525308.1 hypothetical protein [Halomonas sabkhae]